jgi:hypothetical protein
LLAAAALCLGCGGKVTVDDEDGSSRSASGSTGSEDLPATEEELCERSGGQWELDVLDCGGAEDACDLGACLGVIGTGCFCPGDACWDRGQGTCRAP